MKNKLFIDITSALLILLFVYAAGSKLLDLVHYVQLLERMPLLKYAPRFFSLFIPAIEILVAILLFAHNWRSYGLKGSFIVLCCFTGYLLFMLLTMPELPCNCGGVLSQLTWKQHLLFNIFFIAINTVALVMAHQNTVATLKPARSAGQEES